MKRFLAATLMALLCSAPALGQIVGITSDDGRGYGDFGPDDSLNANVRFADLGVLLDWSLDFELGDSVTISGAATFLSPWDSPTSFPSNVVPFGWSSFLGAPVDTAGGTGVITFFVDTDATADDTNSRFGVDLASADTFFTVDTGSVDVTGIAFTGLAAGGQLVPEPATVALLLAGFGGALLRRRRK